MKDEVECNMQNDIVGVVGLSGLVVCAMRYRAAGRGPKHVCRGHCPVSHSI